MTTMTTQTSIPAFQEKSATQTKHRSRTRSGSLLTVEKVGEGSAEQDLDRNLYANINADWVNMKGGYASSTVPTGHIGLFSFSRRLARPPRARVLWKGCGRYYPRNEPGDQLDANQSSLPARESRTPTALAARATLIRRYAGLILGFPLGHGNSIPIRPAWWRLRRHDAVGAD